MAMVMKVRQGEASIKAGEFKAKCLLLMDQVAETGRSILITKRGQPVARLVPVEEPLTAVLGCAKGLFELSDAPLTLAPRSRKTSRAARTELLAAALDPVLASPGSRKRRLE
jgi:prevent-host-death family protein